jgi:hypothetical protein
MKITEFIEKYAMTERDSQVCKSVYRETEKSEEGWKEELKMSIDFKEPIEEEGTLSASELKKIAVKEKIAEKVKNDNKQNKS